MLFRRALNANEQDAYTLYRYARFLDKCDITAAAEEVIANTTTPVALVSHWFAICRCIFGHWKQIPITRSAYRSMASSCLHAATTMMPSDSLRVEAWWRKST
jgi:hypothetical protein